MLHSEPWVRRNHESFGTLMNHGPVAQLVGSSLTRGCCAPVASPQIQCAHAPSRRVLRRQSGGAAARSRGPRRAFRARHLRAQLHARVFARPWPHPMRRTRELVPRILRCPRGDVARRSMARASACLRSRSRVRAFVCARVFGNVTKSHATARGRASRARATARSRNGAAICVFFILAIARARGCEREAIAALAWNSEHCLSARNVELVLRMTFVRARGAFQRAVRARAPASPIYMANAKMKMSRVGSQVLFPSVSIQKTIARKV